MSDSGGGGDGDTAIIGGSGFDGLPGFAVERREAMKTPYGEPSAPLVFGALSGRRLVFLPRHGAAHTIAPHRINYRANIWALKESGARRIIAFAAVGGISAGLAPGSLVIPDQLIDYTWGRAHTFFDGAGFDGAVFDGSPLKHIEFAKPYSEGVRARIIAAAKKGGIDLVDGAVCAVTQGPRLEPAAVIDRLERDGAGIVGMTGMPDAALARELAIEYAAIAIVVNPAAGRGGDISMEMIAGHLAAGREKAMRIIENLSIENMGIVTMAP